MSYFMVDIESDGPIPGDYSMICFGAVLVDAALDTTFYGQLRPISERWMAEANDYDHVVVNETGRPDEAAERIWEIIQSEARRDPPRRPRV